MNQTIKATLRDDCKNNEQIPLFLTNNDTVAYLREGALGDGRNVFTFTV